MLKEWQGFFQKSKGLVTPGRNQGFSLVELMVVMAIIAIMVLGVFGISGNPITDVKGAIFNLRSDIAYARGEAAKRNATVLVEFLSVGAIDGYKICIDDDPLGGDGACTNAADTMLRPAWNPAKPNEFVEFDEVVQFYDINIGAPAGPNVAPAIAQSGAAWPVPDGITFSGNSVLLFPNGSADENGEVYLYAPDPGDGGAVLKTPPIALCVLLSGVIQMNRWQGGGGWTSR